MKRGYFIIIISVLMCIAILTSGCGTGNQEPDRADSPEQGIEAGEQSDDQTATAEPEDNPDVSGASAGEDLPAGGAENTIDTSFLKLNDSSYEKIDQLLGSREEVQLISWSPDGQTVAFSVGDLGWDDQMYLWEAGKSEPVAIDGARDRICEFAWSPDNRYVLADVGTSIQRTGILVNAEYQVKTDEIGYISEAFWSPDSKWITVGQASDIKPSVAIELPGSVDLCIYPVRINDKIILARGTADYYYLPEKWDSNGVLTYVKTEFTDPSQQETLQYKLDTKSGLVYYPSEADFLRSIEDERGSVEVTNEMRERFNLFARDYRWMYMPDMEYYESFFEANRYAESFGYNNFGYAVFYVLSYLRFPERIEAETMQNAIQSLFVAKEGYADMPHQRFSKLANYEEGYYSPWPEGGPDHNRMFYLLTGLDVEQKGSDELYITVRSKRYYFNDPDVYVAGENEKWLAEKSKEMGVPHLEAAVQLIASGEMIGLDNNLECETTLSIELNERNQGIYHPRIVSSDTYGNDPFEN